MFTTFRRHRFLRIEPSSMDFQRGQIFPAPQCLRLKCHLSNFSPQPMHIQGTFQVKLSCPVDGALTGLSRKSDDIQTLHRTEWLGLSIVLRIVCHEVFAHLARDLEHFADGNSIPQNQPTIFDPSQIETIQQTSLLFFCALLSQQFHSSRIDEVLKHNDFMIRIHRISEISKNGLYR